MEKLEKNHFFLYPPGSGPAFGFWVGSGPFKMNNGYETLHLTYNSELAFKHDKLYPLRNSSLQYVRAKVGMPLNGILDLRWIFCCM